MEDVRRVLVGTRFSDSGGIDGHHGGDAGFPHGANGVPRAGNLRGSLLFVLGAHAQPLHPGWSPVLGHEYLPLPAECAGGSRDSDDGPCGATHSFPRNFFVVHDQRFAAAEAECFICSPGRGEGAGAALRGFQGRVEGRMSSGKRGRECVQIRVKA